MLGSHSFEVIDDLGKALDNDDQYDVIIRAGEDGATVDLQAHSFMLRIRSAYFKLAFSGNWHDNDENGRRIFRKPNITPDVFRVILRYFYTGVIQFGQLERDLMVQTLVAADELGLHLLIDHIEEYFFENLDILQNDLLKTLQTIYPIESLKGLTDICLAVICGNPHLLFASAEFADVDKAILTMVLKRDDLNMTEIETWDALLRWVNLHYLRLGSVDSTLAPGVLEEAQLAIKEHVPLINFYAMTQEQFSTKVGPYQDLLPADLLRGLRKSYRVQGKRSSCCGSSLGRPKRFKAVDSAIVVPSLWQLFIRWLNKDDLNLSLNKKLYGFELLLRGTRDGFGAAEFHLLCDGKGAALVVARLKNSQVLVGGYNPLGWSSANHPLETQDSFIFKLESDDPGSAKLGRANPSFADYAIIDNDEDGPSFGGNLCSDGTTTWSNSSFCAYYENIDLPRTFEIEDYEVFKVLPADDKE